MIAKPLAGQSEVNILIVDDRYDGVLALQAALGGCGYNLIPASSGAEALRKLEEREYALILLDVQMPILDGFETATLIKKNPEWSRIPIIFVTAINKDERYVGQGYEVGAVDYLFKPFDSQILVSKVHVFVDLYRKTKEIEVQAELLRESERREQAQTLVAAEVQALRRYQSLADAIPNIVCRARADGTLDYFNRAWTNYTGLGHQESLGTGWQVAVQAEDLDRFLRSMIDSLISARDFEVECRILHAKSGEWRWNIVHGVAELDENGTLQSWLGTAVDIHDRKEWATQLAAAKDAAENANSAKSSFLANMSHEIRTPLNAIMGFGELLLDPNQNDASRLHGVSIIRRNGQQLLKIIDDILDISKVEANRLEIESIATDLEVLGHDLVSLFNLRSVEKKLTFKLEILGEIPKLIQSDPTRLRQVLNNIVGNAVKFTAEGSVSVSIEHRVQTRQMVFTVRDTGIGMPPSEVEKLFTPFTQVDSSTTRKFGGTGLGLALSRKLSQALGGDIRIAHCAEGEGCVFEILIATGDVSGSPMIREIRARQEERSLASKVLPALEGVHVLLAEDAPDNQVLISRFLHMAGAKVDVAGDGQTAIDKAQRGAYDLILMDIQMPILDGYEATRRLRHAGYQRPILALTAHALKEERERCLENGCNDHLTKPVSRRELIEQVAFYSTL